MSSLVLSQWFLLCTIVCCFLAGLVTRNYSQVDRLWSVLPPIYTLIWLPDFIQNTAYIIPCILVLVWGIRLTFNFDRRGIYKWTKGKGFTGEDHRWLILRGKIKNRFLFELFNLTFISAFQLILIFLFSIPLYYIGKATHAINWIDIVLYSVFAGILILGYIADQQQYNYYALKSKKGPKDARLNLGFNTYGLWKYSRHPNYFCEVIQWIVIFLLLVSATGKFHWSVVGVIFLILLIVGISIFNEQVTRSKYPEFEMWQKATPMFFPFLSWGFRKKYRRIFWEKLI